jgi:hypothetical protein
MNQKTEPVEIGSSRLMNNLNFGPGAELYFTPEYLRGDQPPPRRPADPQVHLPHLRRHPARPMDELAGTPREHPLQRARTLRIRLPVGAGAERLGPVLLRAVIRDSERKELMLFFAVDQRDNRGLRFERRELQIDRPNHKF